MSSTTQQSDSAFVISSTLPWVREKVGEIEEVINDGLKQQTVAPSAKMIWRSEGVENGLARWDRRHPDIVFQDGFRPRSYTTTPPQPLADNFDLIGYATGEKQGLFVCASKVFANGDGTVRRWEPNHRGGGFEYRIFAYGGIDVNRTLGGDYRYPEQFEIDFPGGIHPAFIRSAYEYDDFGNARRLWVNKANFDIQRNESHAVPNFRLPEIVSDSAGIQVVLWGGPGSHTGFQPINSAEQPSSTTYPAPRLRKLVREGVEDEDEDEMMRVAGTQKPAPSSFEGATPRRAAVACPWFGDHSFYIFSDQRYIRIRVSENNEDSIVTHPTSFAGAWHSLSCFDHLDAFMPYPNGGGVWAFSKDQYRRIDIDGSGNDTAKYSAKPITVWNTIKGANWNSLDAVIVDPSDNKQVWFFHGKRCLKAQLCTRIYLFHFLLEHCR